MRWWPKDYSSGTPWLTRTLCRKRMLTNPRSNRASLQELKFRHPS
jgi:hypothetical protein